MQRVSDLSCFPGYVRQHTCAGALFCEKIPRRGRKGQAYEVIVWRDRRPACRLSGRCSQRLQRTNVVARHQNDPVGAGVLAAADLLLRRPAPSMAFSVLSRCPPVKPGCSGRREARLQACGAWMRPAAQSATREWSASNPRRRCRGTRAHGTGCAPCCGDAGIAFVDQRCRLRSDARRRPPTSTSRSFRVRTSRKSARSRTHFAQRDPRRKPGMLRRRENARVNASLELARMSGAMSHHMARAAWAELRHAVLTLRIVLLPAYRLRLGASIDAVHARQQGGTLLLGGILAHLLVRRPHAAYEQMREKPSIEAGIKCVNQRDGTSSSSAPVPSAR